MSDMVELKTSGFVIAWIVLLYAFSFFHGIGVAGLLDRIEVLEAAALEADK